MHDLIAALEQASRRVADTGGAFNWRATPAAASPRVSSRADWS